MPHDTSRGRTNSHPARPAAARSGRPGHPGHTGRVSSPGPGSRARTARPVPGTAATGGTRRRSAPTTRAASAATRCSALGEGGQGIVYLGRDRDGEFVTVKLLRGGATAGQRARSRFVKEADAALQVSGRHTARVLDADMSGDRPYIVSEFVEGPRSSTSSRTAAR